jgi:hypothetical protein
MVPSSSRHVPSMGLRALFPNMHSLPIALVAANTWLKSKCFTESICAECGGQVNSVKPWRIDDVLRAQRLKET